MQIHILRCMTPDMVHKEIGTHLLAYNLLRTVLAVAANENDIEPRKQKKVSGTSCRNGPTGALHKRFLTPFSYEKYCRAT